ncbi:hypothetical protein ILYODFUR_030897 [Ilyodon furcidens]|uniref:Uncharacterized protein n=1 Tax=Ilyodon furcidens TaxID=33524 RepID=A0ABV0V7J2_9TELE
MHTGEEYVSISYLKPVLHILETSVLAADLTLSIQRKILKYLRDNHSDLTTQQLLDTASLLDPRFKTKYITADNIPPTTALLKSQLLETAKHTSNEVNNGCQTHKLYFLNPNLTNLFSI